MNDHDNIITLLSRTDYLIKEVQSLRDGTRQDITTLFAKIDSLEKSDIEIRNDIKNVNTASDERFKANGLRITDLEQSSQEGVQRTESNKAYIWRKVFEAALPFGYAVIGGAIIWAVNNHILK